MLTEKKNIVLIKFYFQCMYYIGLSWGPTWLTERESFNLVFSHKTKLIVSRDGSVTLGFKTILLKCHDNTLQPATEISTHITLTLGKCQIAETKPKFVEFVDV